MSTGKKVAANTLIQLVGRIIGLFLMLVTLNAISNKLIVNGSAVTGYGEYTIVFAYASLIGAAADLGLFSLLVRDITRKSREEVEEYIGSALGFRLVLMIVSLLLIFAIYPFLPYSPDVKLGIILSVFVAFSLLFSQTIASVLQVNLMSHRIVIAETIGRVFVMGLTIYVLNRGMGLLAVVVAHLIGYSISIVLSYWLARPLAHIPIRFNLSLWRDALPQFLPIAFVTILSLTHSRIDAVMLSFFQPESEVGLYGIAYKVFEIVIIIPSIFASNLLPVITNFYLQGRKDDFVTVLRRSSSILYLIAALIVGLVILLAPYLIVFISQIEFLAAAQALRILIVSILFIFIAALLIQAVISAHAQKRLITSYGLAVLLNVIINFYAIPHFSYMGAAITTLTTEFVLAVSILLIARKHLNFSLDWAMLAKITISLVVTLGIVWLVQGYYLVSIEQFATLGKLSQASALIAFAIPITIIFSLVFWLTNGGRLPKLNRLTQI
jgi:O-antigen/teichoic acid export membrane protein